MKRQQSIIIFTACLVLCACSSASKRSPALAANAQMETTHSHADHAADGADNGMVVRDEGGSAILQKVAFQSGVSSATVERLARRFGCTGSTGAGLITDKGPVEVYRMRCDNGTTFLAQCELRQCRPMR